MTLREKADQLNISTHTLRNWKKRSEPEEKAFKSLTSRANKLNSPLLQLGDELLQNRSNKKIILILRDELLKIDLSTEGRLFLFILFFLHSKSLLSLPGRQEETDLAEILKMCRGRSLIMAELKSVYNGLSSACKTVRFQISDYFSSAFTDSLHEEADLPGILYQSLKEVGKRSAQGAWFTPLSVIDQLLQPYLKSSRGLYDPCCGSGLFLCRYAELKGSYDGLGGMDLDRTAVFLTRINLYLRFPDIQDLSIIQVGNSLSKGSWNLQESILVASNPPWGAKLRQDEKNALRREYPEIKSGESASYFILKTIRELPPRGRAVYLLPESLFYVQAHADIRRLLLKEAPPRELRDWGLLFKSVYTAVVSCAFQKGSHHRKLTVCLDSEAEKQNLQRYRKNQDSVFNIHCSNTAHNLIQKVEDGPVRALKADFLLGVVTGDNARFLSKKPAPGSIPLLKGKDLMPFYHKEASTFLLTHKGPLQQSRHIEEYKQQKLIYNFIGYKSVFSIDRIGYMTLNSANCLVPEQSNELEELALWYNSDLFRFIWSKRYHSVKMLRHHLENIPLPQWEKKQLQEINSLVQNAENRQDMFSRGNHLIFRHFNLNREEINLVQNTV